MTLTTSDIKAIKDSLQPEFEKSEERIRKSLQPEFEKSEERIRKSLQPDFEKLRSDMKKLETKMDKGFRSIRKDINGVIDYFDRKEIKNNTRLSHLENHTTHPPNPLIY